MQKLDNITALLAEANVSAVEAAAEVEIMEEELGRLRAVKEQFDQHMATAHAPKPEPKPPVVVPTVLGLLGVYNGDAGENPDETTQKEFGAFPDVANTYYQRKQTINLSYETARIKRGTSPNLTITTKGTDLLSRIALGEVTALAWLQRWVNDLVKLADVDRNTNVYATVEHEYRAKVKQGLVTGESAKPLVYAKALAKFIQMVKDAKRPNLKTTYWIVGYDRAFEGSVAAELARLGSDPDYFVFDPYANTATDTITTIVKADLEWFKAQPWYKGQPFGLGEFGMPVKHGDAALGKFYTNVRQQLKNAGISWAVFFNRVRDNNHKITTGAFPAAVKAFSASLGTPVVDPVRPPVEVIDGWTPQYSTTFKDLEGWTVYNDQTQSNDNSVNMAANVKVGPNGLTILGKKETGLVRPFSSGEIVGRSKGLILPNYHRIEVTGWFVDENGVWQCLLWERPENAKDGEIDMMEWMGGMWSGDQKRIAQTMHNEYGATQDQYKKPFILKNNPWFDIKKPHTYTMEKTPGSIKLWIDGRETASFVASGKDWWNRIMEVKDRTWYPRITLQIGAGSGKKVVPNPGSEWKDGEKMGVTSLKIWAKK